MEELDDQQKFASTFHAVDNYLYPDEYRRDFDLFNDALEYVPFTAAELVEGRLVVSDPDTGEPRNDVWGLFVSNVLFRREGEKQQLKRYDDMLGMIPTPRTDEEKDDIRDQARTWNKWTKELKREIKKRKIKDGTDGLFFLTKDLRSTTVKAPEPVSDPEPEPESEPEPEPEPEDEIEVLISMLYSQLRLMPEAARFMYTYFGDGGAGEDYKDTPEAEALLDSMLSKEMPDTEGMTEVERLGIWITFFGQVIQTISRAIATFGGAHADDNTVSDFTFQMGTLLGFG